jgi:hypothetical protein
MTRPSMATRYAGLAPARYIEAVSEALPVMW